MIHIRKFISTPPFIDHWLCVEYMHSNHSGFSVESPGSWHYDIWMYTFLKLCFFEIKIYYSETGRFPTVVHVLVSYISLPDRRTVVLVSILNYLRYIDTVARIKIYLPQLKVQYNKLLTILSRHILMSYVCLLLLDHIYVYLPSNYHRNINNKTPVLVG